MGVKITPADSAFSKCVRARVNWVCEGCGKQYGPSDKGLQCSHFHGRGNWSIRTDPDNAFAHCTGCHYHYEGNPHEFTQWALERLGNGAYEILLEKKRDLNMGRAAKREAKEIAKHYRQEYKRLCDLRDSGEAGRIEFDGYF